MLTMIADFRTGSAPRWAHRRSCSNSSQPRRLAPVHNRSEAPAGFSIHVVPTESWTAPLLKKCWFALAIGAAKMNWTLISRKLMRFRHIEAVSEKVVDSWRVSRGHEF